MKVEVTEIDRIRKKVDVLFSDDEIAKERSHVYDELNRRVRLKGFRPGKIPRDILNLYYRDYIDEELRKRLIETYMGDALSEAKIEPLVEPYVDFIDDDNRFGYSLECEVIPDISLPEYKGIEVETEQVVVTDEEVDNRLMSLRQMHAEIISKDSPEGAKSGDLVIISYQGYEEGKPLKDVFHDSYPLELGVSGIMPEFEMSIVGMKVGEEKDITIDFPQDYPDKAYGGKSILFKVRLKDIKEKRLPEVDDDFAKDLNFENVERLMEGIREEIRKEKEKERERAISEKIINKILSNAEIPVPERTLKRRIDRMVEDALSRYDTERFTSEERKKLEDNYRKDFEKIGEEKLKAEILLSKIAQTEGIKVEDGDVEERIKKTAMEFNRSFDELIDFYEKNNMLEYLKNGILQEKTMAFLKEHAIIKEKT
ncbi:MAG: trigger factor [Syntrophorhabdaceae bacterium]|nr:trigger factor [Syntrophorhabdaceae bacterium]